MITLENISTLPLTGIRQQRRDSEVSRQNCNLIKELHLTDYQKLKDFYDRYEEIAHTKKDFICRSDNLEKKISDVETALEKMNKQEVNAEVFKITENPFLFAMINGKSIVDSQIDGSDLLYGSPFEYGNYQYKIRKGKVIGYTVYELKELLTHCETNGVNSLKYYLSISDNSEVIRILNAIKLYNEQIERQYLECADEEQLPNLFKLNSDKKTKLIAEQIKEIADYIGNNAIGFVWGEYNATEMQRIYLAAYGSSLQDVERRKRLINTLSNYTSLEEAENGLIRTRAINRFLQQKRK